VRIGIVTISFPTLSETFIYNKVLQLANRGHKVVVFCESINTKLFNKLFAGHANVQAIAFTKSSMAMYAALHPWAIVNAAKQKAGIKNTIGGKTRLHYINKHQLDILHVEFSGIGTTLYTPVLKKVTAKKVVSCRGSAEKVKLLVFEDRKKNIRLLFDEVDAIHCVSDDMRQTILPYCDNPSKIFVNFPSIDATQFKRSQPYTANTPVQILSIGRFTFQKGYFTGLLAIKQLLQSFTDFNWVIVGDGTQKEEIIFHINQMGLQNHVLLVGPKNRDEVIGLYNQADIFFLPSVYEGIANVALEAMAMELPVVATKSGGMQEVITHGVNGLLANVYDSATLAGLLLALATDATTRAALGKQARERVLQQFTLEKQITIFETTYNNLLNNQTIGI
jgi:colanic acid/amylovoran biosynthesis glycosyltransferase